MRRFVPDELLAFLRQVDDELDQECGLVLIGGAVIALAYQGRHATQDIDYVQADAPFAAAYARALQRSPVPVSMQPVGIFLAPLSYEERLRPISQLGLKRLRLWA